VDWNVIFLLISMMLIVNIMTKTGVFQYVAIKAAKLGKGNPFTIMAIFAVVTAVGSAFLDNVTTVLLLAPVTLLIATELEIDPVPYLITEALASNIGGTATLIGDPPNIMIASKAGFDFMDFIVHLSPAIIVIMGVWMLVWKVVFGKRLHVREELKARIMAMNENELIKDPALLKKSGAVLGLTILGFILHGFFH
jgi:Na+/H+ antiporter NhaD/arsenite permease-like protein